MSKPIKRQPVARKIKAIFKKTLGFILVLLVLAFVAYHFYSVGNFAKDFSESTGAQPSSK